jgi:hypothetical protein
VCFQLSCQMGLLRKVVLPSNGPGAQLRRRPPSVTQNQGKPAARRHPCPGTAPGGASCSALLGGKRMRGPAPAAAIRLQSEARIGACGREAWYQSRVRTKPGGNCK